MKVVLLTPEIFSSEGGLSRILRLHLKALCEIAGAGDEVRLVTLIDPTLESTDLRSYAGERLTDWEACGRSRLRFTRATLRLARGCDWLICGHVNQLRVAALAKLRYPRLRYILVAHGLEVWRSFGATEMLALKGAEQVWCVSEYTRGELLRRASLSPARVRVLPNALDPFLQENARAAAAAGSAASAPTLLTVSRLAWSDRYKGVDHLIQAFPAVRQRISGARLRIVGRGDDLPRLQQLAGPYQLSGDIQFPGFLSDDALSRELAGCRAFALPSEKEGFGLVYLEAMAHGKPCVGARAGGTPEVISPESGLLAPYGDIDALARACIAALETPWDAAAIRARANSFSYAVFRDRLRNLLDG
jgi:glycosyltransferase involved in cell wall biosynthesis